VASKNDLGRSSLRRALRLMRDNHLLTRCVYVTVSFVCACVYARECT